MLKEQAKVITRINVAVDTAAIVGAFFLAYWMRSRQGGLHDVYYYAWILLVIIPVWLALLAYFGCYASQRISSICDILTNLIKVNLLGGLVTSSVIYLLEPRGFSRSFFILVLLCTLSLLSMEHLVVRRILHMLRQRGYNFRNMLLVGTERDARKMVDLVNMNSSWGLRILGVVQPEDAVQSSDVDECPVLGGLPDLLEICKKHPVDEVLVCSTYKEFRIDVEELVQDLVELGITVRTVLDVYYRLNTRKELSMFHGEVPLITFHANSITGGPLVLKRCLDIIGACVGLAIAVVMFPFVALAIKLESPGKLMFGQTRVRENGRLFTCWKFRSMFADAEERKNELLEQNEVKGAMFKVKDDPRVTRVGRFIRKTSLDELPQFWNVLKGEMSLVGTRPPTPDEMNSYENWHYRRICIKPGVTGLWQVSGRNEIKDFDEVVRLDLEYIDNWSLLLDIKILLRTLKVVFLREGSQ